MDLAAEIERKRSKKTEMEVYRAKALPPALQADYCQKCSYPRRDGICFNCRDEKTKMFELSKRYALSIGGLKAWNEYTEDGFEVSTVNQRAFEAAKAFDPRVHNLYFHSYPGTGKSRLAAIAKRRWILNEMHVITMSLDDFYMQLRMVIKDARAQKDLVEKMIAVPLLGLEDIGVEKDTEFTTNVFFQIIDGRYKQQRNGLVITSNLSPDALAGRLKNDRVSSRLHELCKKRIFDLKGERDWRRVQ